MRRGAQTVQQTGRPEQEGPGADARRQGAGPALPRDPVEDDRVLLLAPGAIAAWNHDEVEWRMIVERVIGLHEETAAAGDDLGPLGNREDLEEPRLETAIGLRGQGGAGEDLERPTEIENLDIRKDQDADVSRLRGLHHRHIILSSLAYMMALDSGSVDESTTGWSAEPPLGSRTSS